MYMGLTYHSAIYLREILTELEFFGCRITRIMKSALKMVDKKQTLGGITICIMTSLSLFFEPGLNDSRDVLELLMTLRYSILL